MGLPGMSLHRNLNLVDAEHAESARAGAGRRGRTLLPAQPPLGLLIS